VETARTNEMGSEGPSKKPASGLKQICYSGSWLFFLRKMFCLLNVSTKPWPISWGMILFNPMAADSNELLKKCGRHSFWVFPKGWIWSTAVLISP